MGGRITRQFSARVLLIAALVASIVRADEQAVRQRVAPDFGPNVLVFDPSVASIQQQIDAVYAKQESNQFGDERFALLFKPGKYNLDVQIGFYTHLAGLGRSPDDVEITGAVRSKAKWMKGNATCNFWRAVENFSVVPTAERSPNMWAVSQAAPMRRAHIKGDIVLADSGWSSGGFIADSKIDGEINSGSQQQWFSRNAQWNRWRGGNWNMVFVGVTNPPEGDWPERPYTTIEKTPLIREKPYLFVDESGNYFVQVPELRADGSVGITWADGASRGQAIPIEQFHIARSDRDDAATINEALNSGKHLLLTPGIYRLDRPLRISRPDTIVLGIGYPILRPERGTPAMLVSDVDGVKLAGILFEAGEIESPTLLEVGEAGSSALHAGNPIFLFDIFCRAGGAIVGSTSSFVTINSNNVIGDHFWLWRADHGAGAKWDVNKNKNGLIVNGSDVTIYGLFVEHCQEYQTIWNGERGRVYFYQSEMPYDPPSNEVWSHDGVRGYASYKVADHVKAHEAWGLGVYCVFYAGPIIADTAIEAPVGANIKMNRMVTIRLSGKPGSGIMRVLNDQGDAVMTPQAKKAIIK